MDFRNAVKEANFINGVMTYYPPSGTEQVWEDHLQGMVERGDIGDVRFVSDSHGWNLNGDRHVFSQEGWAEEQGAQQIDFPPSLSFAESAMDYRSQVEDERIAIDEAQKDKWLKEEVEIALTDQRQAWDVRKSQITRLEEQAHHLHEEADATSNAMREAFAAGWVHTSDLERKETETRELRARAQELLDVADEMALDLTAEQERAYSAWYLQREKDEAEAYEAEYPQEKDYFNLHVMAAAINEVEEWDD